MKNSMEDGTSLDVKPFGKFLKVDEKDLKETMGERSGKNQKGRPNKSSRESSNHCNSHD